MSMREKIADICDNEMINTSPSCYSLADAIITALPDMIKPLEWDAIASTEKGYILYAKGYGIDTGATRGKYYVMFHGRPLVDGKGECVWHYTEAEAVSSANAHNAAAIMGAFE